MGVAGNSACKATLHTMIITTKTELTAAIESLPSLSRKLYDACIDCVECEVESSGEVSMGEFYLDNAYDKAGVSPRQASGIFSHLSGVGLYEENCDCFGIVAGFASE